MAADPLALNQFRNYRMLSAIIETQLCDLIGCWAASDLAILGPTQIRTLAALAVVTPLGFATKAYAGPGAYWVNSHAGGVLYVIFWVLVIVFIRPQTSPWAAGPLVFAATCLLEALQLLSTPTLAAVRSTFLGHALIGSTFGWWDFPHYLLGAVLGVAVTLRATRPPPVASDA